jgi:hypothetical protein
LYRRFRRSALPRKKRIDPNRHRSHLLGCRGLRQIQADHLHLGHLLRPGATRRDFPGKGQGNSKPATPRQGDTAWSWANDNHGCSDNDHDNPPNTRNHHHGCSDNDNNDSSDNYNHYNDSSDNYNHYNDSSDNYNHYNDSSDNYNHYSCGLTALNHFNPRW